MTLTIEQKAWLNTESEKIYKSFNTFKSIRAYMAVYSLENSSAYCTFGNDMSFPGTININRVVTPLMCVYNCTEDFTNQTNNFLNN